MIGSSKWFSSDDENEGISLRTVLVASVVITIFLDVILFYYSMIHEEKRDNIIRNGQITAVRSATRVNDYLSSSIDVVKLTAYALEGMQAEGRTNEEIQNFLVWQTVAVKSAVFENTTGMCCSSARNRVTPG